MQNIPNLKTLMSNQILDVEKPFLNNQHEIEHWFRSHWQIKRPPFYGSVDLRNSGYKIAPVDMNLFPGGFNNINPEFIPLAVQAINNVITKYCPDTQKILLIPENHTRNLAYLKNIYTLNYILETAGIETVIGSLSPEITEPTLIKVASENYMTYHPLIRTGDKIHTKSGFTPCLILLNNDLSGGAPEILQNLSQMLLPPLNAGWYFRKKTHFFNEYNKVADDFAKLINIDPWLINPYFESTTNLDFAQKTGLEELAHKIDIILTQTRIKYKEYNVSDDPYVIVKANNGTYGMGIMSIKDPLEIEKINRKTRNKMSVIKDGIQVNEVIIQEGVTTFEEINHHTAEPVVYMIDSAVIGGFYRVNADKGKYDNLNSSGASFIPLYYSNACLSKKVKGNQSKCPTNRFYTYSVIARLSLLASSNELANYMI